MTIPRLIFYALMAVAGFAAGRHWHTHAQAPALTGQAFVLDGDSIALGEVRVRILGIDAPELDQTCKDSRGETYRCGLLALDVLEEEIGGRPVTCFPADTDHYGRVIASCEVGGHDLGDVMVRRGFAIAYLRYSTKYLEAEAEARRAKRGVWQGDFVEPEEWRHRK